MTKICYHLSLLLLFFDPGSEIRDPGQCCGSETFISDPFSDLDPANSEFRQIVSFGSGFGSGSEIIITDGKGMAKSSLLFQDAMVQLVVERTNQKIEEDFIEKAYTAETLQKSPHLAYMDEVTP
jgi:hypothetical protein